MTSGSFTTAGGWRRADQRAPQVEDHGHVCICCIRDNSSYTAALRRRPTAWPAHPAATVTSFDCEREPKINGRERDGRPALPAKFKPNLGVFFRVSTLCWMMGIRTLVGLPTAPSFTNEGWRARDSSDTLPCWERAKNIEKHYRSLFTLKSHSTHFKY